MQKTIFHIIFLIGFFLISFFSQVSPGFQFLFAVLAGSLCVVGLCSIIIFNEDDKDVKTFEVSRTTLSSTGGSRGSSTNEIL